jgi:hypothetical protein
LMCVNSYEIEEAYCFHKLQFQRRGGCIRNRQVFWPLKRQHT